MTFQQKHEALLQEVVAKLKTITDRSEGWLPHTVYMEQEGEDCQGRGIPVYTQYKLLDFDSDGACKLLNVALNEIEDDYYLSEIQLEWLITVLNYYSELTGVDVSAPNPKELKVFVCPVDLERNISDAELIELWNDDNIQTYTPDEFATLINDEMFDEANNYIRFINI